MEQHASHGPYATHESFLCDGTRWSGTGGSYVGRCAARAHAHSWRCRSSCKARVCAPCVPPPPTHACACSCAAKPLQHACAGHLLPGIFLCTWALHWFASCTFGHLTGRRLQPRGAAHYGFVGLPGALQVRVGACTRIVVQCARQGRAHVNLCQARLHSQATAAAAATRRPAPCARPPCPCGPLSGHATAPWRAALEREL